MYQNRSAHDLLINICLNGRMPLMLIIQYYISRTTGVVALETQGSGSGS
jgi:hypothetical protein